MVLNLEEKSFRVCIVCVYENKTNEKCEVIYIYSQYTEAQLGYLPSCPPWVTQRDERGATGEFTVLPLIHVQCISGATWDLNN